MASDPNYQPPSAELELPAAPGTVPPGPDATPEEKDLWWFRNVYAGDQQRQLTWRAVLTGGLLGACLSLSNLYTTLKIGWAFGVAITACVLSWAIWRGLRAAGITTAELSILETNCMQSTASSAGYSTGSVVGSACAAILMVNNGQNMAWPVMTAFVFLTACLGVLMAVPMKRQMINHEQLPFPSGIAAAETLRSLYAAGAEAKKKASMLLWALGAAAVLGVLRNLGSIADEGRTWIAWQLDKGLSAWEWISQRTAETWIAFSNAITHIHLWQPATAGGVKFVELKFDPSLLTIGAGMIVGLRASVSMLLGAAILHYGLGPLLVEHSPANLPDATVAALEAQHGKDWFQYVPEGYNALKVKAGGETALFRWGVWAGTALMVVASLVSLGFQWGSIVRSFRRRRGEGGAEAEAMAAIEVPGKWMLLGIVPVTLGLIAVLDFGLGIPWYLALIGVIISFPLALVACRATGETDTTPIGAMGKVTQLAFAFMHPGQKVTNLATAGTTSAAAASAADLLSDLKSGYLLGANPRRQFLAQLSGVIFGTAVIVPAWYLLSRDYDKLTEKFTMQAANAWKAMADLLNPANGKSALESLPWGAPQAIIIGAILGVLLPVLEKCLPKFRNWIPSAIGLGLGFVIDFASGLGFTTGALMAYMWKKANPAQAERYTVPLGSGFVAGQAMMEAFIMILIAANQMRH